MEDNEIVKALEDLAKCSNNEIDCGSCSLSVFYPLCPEKIGELALDLINHQKEEIERLKEKSIVDDKLLNDRVQEAITTVSKANQKYVDVLEKTFNDRTTELKTAKAEIEELKSAINSFRGYEDTIKSEARKEFAERVKNIAVQYCREIDNLLKEMESEEIEPE